MSTIGWIRNTMIFAGMGAGVLLAIRAGLAPVDVESPEKAAARTSVELATTRPQAAATANLEKPASLDSLFGRQLLTGLKGGEKPPGDPLRDLAIDRQYDDSIDTAAPKSIPDLPPRRAEDEVAPGEAGAPVSGTDVADDVLTDLPEDARQSAITGRTELEEGNKAFKTAIDTIKGVRKEESLDDADKLLNKAAKHFEKARDLFREALVYAPKHKGLLDLLRDALENIYAAHNQFRKR